MRTRLKVLLAVTVVLLAAVCGGWKWHDGYNSTKSAGFTWDSQLTSWVEADSASHGPDFYGFIWDNGGS